MSHITNAFPFARRNDTQCSAINNCKEFMPGMKKTHAPVLARPAATVGRIPERTNCDGVHTWPSRKEGLPRGIAVPYGMPFSARPCPLETASCNENGRLNRSIRRAHSGNKSASDKPLENLAWRQLRQQQPPGGHHRSTDNVGGIAQRFARRFKACHRRLVDAFLCSRQ